jgi:hypothetical protein
MLGFKTFVSEADNFASEPIVIEFLDGSNNWRQVESGVINNPRIIAWTLQNTKSRYPKNRLRAMGSSSRRMYDMVM